VRGRFQRRGVSLGGRFIFGKKNDSSKKQTEKREIFEKRTKKKKETSARGKKSYDELRTGKAVDRQKGEANNGGQKKKRSGP